MNSIQTLIKRNLLNYIYDPSAVFFSFLSVLILVAVYILFLGTLQVNYLHATVGDIAGIRWLVNSWLLAGLLTVTSFTVPLSISSHMVVDIEKKVFDDFLVAPIRRSSIVLGYAVSAFIIGVVMTSLTYVVGQIVLVLTGGEWLDAASTVRVGLFILLSNAVFSSISFLMISFIRSTASVNAVNTIVGTLLGFLAGIYVPFSAFSDTVAHVLKLNPAAQVVVLFRDALMHGPMNVVFAGAPAEIQANYVRVYGLSLEIFEIVWPGAWIVVYVLGFSALMMILSVLRLNAFKR